MAIDNISLNIFEHFFQLQPLDGSLILCIFFWAGDEKLFAPFARMLKLFSLATAVVGWPSAQAWKRDQPRRAFRSLVLRHLGWSFPSKKGMMIPLNSYVWDWTTRISWNVQSLSTSNLPNANVFRVVFSHYQVTPFRIGDGAAGSSGESWPRLPISWHSFRQMKFPGLGAWLQALGDLKQMLIFTQPVGMMFSLVTNIWWKRREISSSFSEFLAISDSGPQRFYRLWLLMGECGLSELW